MIATKTKAKPKMKRKIWVAAHTEDTRDASLTITEPDDHSEFEVQATLWHGLRALGINARGEVKTSFAGRACVRFDLAVFEAGALAGIIEVKKSAINHKTTWEQTRQGSRYAQFAVPVRIVYGMDDAAALLEHARLGQLFAAHP
jgi:hypothetical protein